MPVNVRVALISRDGTILAWDMDSFDPTTIGGGSDAVIRASDRLRTAWRHVTDEERAEFGEAMASIVKISAIPEEGQGGEELVREAFETWRLAGVFGRVNCPHGCKQVAADAECPHGYPSLAKRMGVKF